MICDRRGSSRRETISFSPLGPLVSKKPARHLSLLADSLPAPPPTEGASKAATPFQQLAAAFQQACGWELRLSESHSEAGEAWSALIDDQPQQRLVILPGDE